MIFQSSYIQTKKFMTIRLRELRSNLSLKDAANSTEGVKITLSSVNFLKYKKIQEKPNTCVISYVVKWIKTIFLTVSSFASTSLSRCFSLLSPFFVLSYLEIIRCIVRSLIATLKCFLLKYNWKNKTWKMFFWGARVWVPKQVNQMAWIHHWNLAKLRELKK